MYICFCKELWLSVYLKSDRSLMYIILRIRGSKHRGFKYVFFFVLLFFDPKCKSVVIDHRQFRQSSKG